MEIQPKILYNRLNQIQEDIPCCFERECPDPAQLAFFPPVLMNISCFVPSKAWWRIAIPAESTATILVSGSHPV